MRRTGTNYQARPRLRRQLGGHMQRWRVWCGGRCVRRWPPLQLPMDGVRYVTCVTWSQPPPSHVSPRPRTMRVRLDQHLRRATGHRTSLCTMKTHRHVDSDAKVLQVQYLQRYLRIPSTLSYRQKARRHHCPDTIYSHSPVSATPLQACALHQISVPVEQAFIFILLLLCYDYRFFQQLGCGHKCGIKVMEFGGWGLWWTVEVLLMQS